MQPTAVPRWVRRPEGQWFFRSKRMGSRRLMLFMPLIVLKTARGHHAEMLRREAENAKAAARNPFWSDVAVTSLRIGRSTAISRRHAQVQLADFAEIAAWVERRLDAALAARRGPAVGLIADNPVFAALSPSAQQRVRAALRGLEVPITGMHGDMHMFNFCRVSRGGFGLLDWEYYVDQGSFAFDYTEFHACARYFGQELKWPEYFENTDAPDPAATRAAARLGVDVGAFWLVHLLIKLNAVAVQRGGFANQPDADRAQFLAIVQRQIDRLTDGVIVNFTDGRRRPPTKAERWRSDAALRGHARSALRNTSGSPRSE